MPFLRLLLIDPHDKFRVSARKYLLRCREFNKESFSVNLFDYLASRQNRLTGRQTGSHEEAD